MPVTVTEYCKEGGQVAHPTEGEVALLKRLLMVLTVALVMALMLVVIAVPAMAKNLKVGVDPITGELEEVQTGSPIESGHPQHNTVIHCDSLAEELLGLEDSFHGAVPFGTPDFAASNTTCREAPVE